MKLQKLKGIIVKIHHAGECTTAKDLARKATDEYLCDEESPATDDEIESIYLKSEELANNIMCKCND